jgi:hypothetical protein
VIRSGVEDEIIRTGAADLRHHGSVLPGSGFSRRRSRHRVIRDLVIAAVGLACVGFAGSMLIGVGGSSDHLATALRLVTTQGL